MRRNAQLLLLVLSASFLGCSRDKGEHPRAVADPQQIGLAAVSVDDAHLDAGLVGAAASGEETAKPAAGAGPAQPAIQVDQSTQETAAKSYVDVINSGQIAQLATLVMADQQQAVTELAPIVAPLTQAAAQLHKALGEKFSGHAFVISIQNEAIPADWLKHWTVSAAPEIDAADANTATAKLQVENGADTATRTLKKVDDKWYVQEPNVPTADAAKGAQETLTQLAEAFKGLAGRVEELADADAADKELANVIANPGAAAPTAEAKAPAPAKANANAGQAKPASAGKGPKPERSKSELEQDMDSAAGRSTLAPGL